MNYTLILFITILSFVLLFRIIVSLYVIKTLYGYLIINHHDIIVECSINGFKSHYLL